MPHYFDEQTTTASDVVTFDVALPDVAFSIRSDRGVFSHGHLDNGTSLLLKEGPGLPETGTFLDIGCGAGPIAIAMALRAPEATVWAIDVNERARSLTAANAKRNHAGNVRVSGPDDVPTDLQFDEIWSNPPIRIGKAALHQLLVTWIDRLAPTGQMVLVVQKHLGADSLQAWLNRQGVQADRIASRSGFRLLRVVRNQPATTPACARPHVAGHTGSVSNDEPTSAQSPGDEGRHTTGPVSADASPEAFDLDDDGKISIIEAERARLGVVDARMAELAKEDGVKGTLAKAAHEILDKIDND